MKRCAKLFLIVCSGGLLGAAPRIIEPRTRQATALAIVIDSVTYAKTSTAVEAYRQAVETDELATYIVVDQWRRPEEIKAVLIRLTERQPIIEGAVFIGDIPVPMLRDAQHLTTAFKMDQERYPFERSSVPSDRFYDDFDLRFDFIRQDTANTLLFYYTLRADSPQKINREIYSGRIKPPVDDSTKYQRIATYLQRIALQKRQPEILNEIFTFQGHGYHSEALDAWECQVQALREQFPPSTRIKNLHHSRSGEVKNLVITALREPALDLAIFHAHGDFDTQYLIGYPPAENIEQNVAVVKLFLRSKMREARRRRKSVEEVVNYFREAYGVPESWFAEAFADSLVAADSVYSANLDIYATDARRLAPQAEVIIFDECFNGCFIKSSYIAGEYVFGKGTTIAGVANTVNVRQDIWADEMLGTLAHGVRLGRWHQTRNYLETHIIGDPTFRFKPDVNNTLPGKDLLGPNKTLDWGKLLQAPEPLLRTVAVFKMYQLQGARFESELVKIYRHDPAFNVRLEALKCLADLRTPAFEDLLKISTADSYELIRRFSANWMGLLGKDEYLPYLAQKTIFDVSERVTYIAQGAIEKISPTLAWSACEAAFRTPPFDLRQPLLEERLKRSFTRSEEWLKKELMYSLTCDTLPLKKRIEAVRTFRNYQFREAVPELLEVAMDDSAEPVLRRQVLEALGWFGLSSERNEIIATCQQIMKSPGSPQEVRQEAEKTWRRLAQGPNDPLIY